MRMTRRDIASYLGVAHETVSRSFAELVGWGFLRVDNREVDILDLEGLRTFSSCTRRPHEEGAWPRVAHRPAALRRRAPAAPLDASARLCA
jgi:CRP/FNR family transcriptional regulator, anaerobic regulatory protein